MLRMHFSIIINASKQKVWNTMLDDESYRKWTEVFMPGSHYVGDWSQGSKMLFLAPGEKGESGMVSRIKENRPYEYISIEHVGVVQDGVEDLSTEAVKVWAGGFEDYRFSGVEGGTEVLVDMFGTDAIDGFREMFETTWPKALQKLKELAEKRENIIVKRKPKSKLHAPAKKRNRKKVISGKGRIKRRR